MREREREREKEGGEGDRDRERIQSFLKICSEYILFNLIYFFVRYYRIKSKVIPRLVSR